MSATAPDGPAIRGWCPGALRPMAAADGLVVRLRPPLGRLTPTQAHAVAAAAERFGAGEVELTSRAGLQIRGVDTAGHPALIDLLAAEGLIDADPEAERSRNLVVTPFHQPGDGTAGLAEAAAAGLLAAPLPDKFGAAIDTGAAPVLQETPADIRLERASDGRLLLRPDGSATGLPVTDATLPAALADLLSWFLSTGGVRDGRGRMRAHLASGQPIPPGYDTPPAPPAAIPRPGPAAGDSLAVAAFGVMSCATLASLAGIVEELRLTPWRGLFLPGVPVLPPLPGLLADPDDPLARVDSCTGRPGCAQALAETRPLARALAARLPAGARLHVSGCAKGCARPGPSDLTLTATRDGFELATNARAGDPPIRRGLTAESLLSAPDPFGAP